MTLGSGLQGIGQLSIAVACVASSMAASTARAEQDLDRQVLAALRSAGFTGTIQSQFLPRLGRPLNPQLVDLGRLLWFDKSGGPPRRQYVRWVSLAEPRIRRHAVDRDRHPEQQCCRAPSHG